MSVTIYNIESKIKDATSRLIDLGLDICWNKISTNCVYIISEINDNIGKNSFERAKIRKKINDKKEPKSLSKIISDLIKIYDNLYDINLHIYKSLPNQTIVEIRYFLKSSHTEEYYPTIKNDNPMLHCKIARPFYVDDYKNSNKKEKKFDINWELGGTRHELNIFLGKIKYYIWLSKYNFKQTKRKIFKK